MQELTERQKGLLTLLSDKMNSHGYMMGAHRNSNWHTQAYYERTPGAEQMQGTLDRIGKIEYHRTFHTDYHKPKEGSWFGHERVGPEFYDHSIRCEWKEWFGKGWGPNPPESMLEHTFTAEDGKEYHMPSSLTKDKAGNWHSPCDSGFWLCLYHPSKQNGDGCGEGQEAIGGCWLRRPYPRWRPTYHYTDAEVIEALKIMCEAFGWEFEQKDDSEWTYT